MVGAISCFTTFTVTMASEMLQTKVPMKTSILTGQEWLEELMNGRFSASLMELQV
jgi:hypothetical protein